MRSVPGLQVVAYVPAVALAALLALSGCSSQTTVDPPSEAEAEADARAALEAFAQDVSGDGGELRRIEGTFTSAPPAAQDDQEPVDPYDDEPGFDLGTTPEMPMPEAGTFELEWGTDGARRLQFAATGNGFDAAVEVVCTRDAIALTFSGTTYLQRPTASSPCGEAGQELGGGVPIDDAAGWTVTDVEVDGDGSAVTFDAPQGPEGPATVTVHLDAKGRLEGIDATTPEGDVGMAVERGDRRSIDVPDEGTRVPADIVVAFSRSGSTVTGNVAHADPAVEMAELELRLLVDGSPVAHHPLQAGDVQVTDADGDGKLSQGDTIVLAGAAAGDAQLYDTWADAPVGEMPIPVPGVALAAAGLLGAALMRRK